MIFTCITSAAGEHFAVLGSKNRILPYISYKISAAGEIFTVSGSDKYDFTLQNERRRRTICAFKALLRRFYRTKFALQMN